ncbi:MAG: SPFH domain-containing protein [Anaerolineae bacterium]|nr:SPFH domain-containing protein [Anaerolineae bacterium]
MNTLFGAFIIALALGAAAAFLIGAATARQGRPNYRAAYRAGVVVLLVALAMAALTDAFVQVEAGSVAVVKQFGKVVGVFYPGLNVKAPFIQEVVTYRTQEIVYETSEDPKTSQADYRDLEVDTATSDGQQIRARYTIRFRIDPTRLVDIVNNLGTEPEVVEKIVKATSRVHVRNILKQHPATDLYSGNVERAQEEIRKRLEEEFNRGGLQLIFFGLRSIHFEPEYIKAVEQKQIEKENIITKENLAKQAEFEKQRLITQAQGEAERERLQRIGQAQGEAEAIRLKAIADAEAIRIKAEAQAQANRLIAESLNANMLNWQAIQQWDGRYPTVLGGGANVILPGDLFKTTEK